MMTTPRRLKFEFAMLAILGGVFIGANLPDLLAARSGAYDFFDPLVDLRHHLVRHYVEPVDEQAMLEGAIDGMLETLDDPYTNYFPPKALDSFEKQTSGTFSGIGAEIEVRNGQLLIITPLEDSPAFKAGIMPGDIVLEIDGESIEPDITATEAVERITGEEGTEVTPQVKHDNGQTEDLTITRARIKVETVRGTHRDDNGHWNFMLEPTGRIGYIRLTQFSGTSYEELQSAIDELQKQRMRGLILDLRYNPGGLLGTAVQVADLFLDEGKIVSTRGRTVEEMSESAQSDGTLPDFPLIVLINRYSASASEILSGALKDHDRAIILGERTLGKGSVQRLFPIEGGEKGGVKLTTSHYYLPSGRNIHRHKDNDQWGVDPTDGYYVPMTVAEREAMAETRRSDNNPFAKTTEAGQTLEVTPQWIEAEMKDKQLAAALRAMNQRLGEGQYAVVGKSNATVQAHLAEREQLRRAKELIAERLDTIDERIDKLTDKIEKIQNGEETEETDTASNNEVDDDPAPDAEVRSDPVEEIETPPADER